MNGSIRLFAGAYNGNAPHECALPGTMGGRGQGLHRDLTIARNTRANVLVFGPEQAVSNALALMIVDVEHATVIDRSTERFRLPSAVKRVPTVIIRNVDALSHDEQRELVDLLLVSKGHSRVIATTSRSLFALVDTREFSATLYYRLNTVYVDLT